MATVEIRLLGGYAVNVDGLPVDLPGQKERALLAFLAVESNTLHRRELNRAGFAGGCFI
ncbi:MAG: hypothetical protein R3229_18785 [Alphaproteobacteria bacterium]|nr:hypothetical protein [Alphaproteobacteria bacterium]